MSVNKNAENFIYNVYLLRDLIGETLSATSSAFEVLTNGKYDEVNSYQLGLGYVAIANQSYLSAKVLCVEHSMESGEVSRFFDAYSKYRSEFDEYVIEKDTNSSWLYSRLSEFKKDCAEASEFLTNHIKDYYATR